MPKRVVSVASARNDEWLDSDILGIITDVADPDGYATTTEIALKMGFTGNGNKGQTPAIKVASRLVAMRRGQLLESAPADPDSRGNEPGAHDTRWKPTEHGIALLRGRLSKAVENQIDRMDPGALLLLQRRVARSGYINGNEATAFAIRREFDHHRAHRRLFSR